MAANMADFGLWQGSFPESVLSTELPDLVMLMHEECLLWPIDAEYFILKFQSKMADVISHSYHIWA